ncbi:DUF2892 domain-containing protein [Paucidesulfovibrio longus]|uniref:DUF2892 domain-containing protein n=1 Tax=Paucidesulfovibrio longus TaxID=889 RepID=UPI0003B3EC0C|nr:DUF2892 domain-containing protein [Paucidesulfovibrio longus]
MSNTDRFWSIISGALLIYVGQDVAHTGVFSYGIAGDHFEIHPWVGWFLAMLGVFWLAEGLYSFLGGKKDMKATANDKGDIDTPTAAPGPGSKPDGEAESAKTHKEDQPGSRDA